MKKYIVLAIMLLSLLVSAVPPSLIAAEKRSGTTSVKKVKKMKKKSSGKADYNALNFLPFGVGQFRQGRPIIGGMLGGGQAMMLFLYMDRKKQITASNKDANTTIAEISASAAPASAETQSYLERNAAYVKKTNTEANLCLLGFMGLYAAGVVDAVWLHVGAKESAAKKAAEIEDMDDSAAKWAAEKKLDLLQNKPRFSMFALPTMDKSKNTIGVTWEKSFR
ncbi:MAG: hypothetical protein H7318_08250 [Oligoflexus sp.]|nr:hypothetical protein [Oligoflexus sp.]